MTNNTFRFITHEIFDGAYNMAVDEAILDAHREGSSPATLRIYGWKPHAVSLGYAQKFSDDQIARCEERGFAVVRRPTGGRAVLHTGELTYSFIASSEDILGSSVAQAYMQICQGLLKGMSILGVELEVGTASRSYKDFHDCFQATTNADLHFNGKKMIGSAQLRRHNGVLQHGSILLNQPQDLMAELLEGTNKHSNQNMSVATRHANLFEILGETISIERLQEALKRGFEEAFEASFATDNLTEYERKLAQEYRSKYEIVVQPRC